MLVVWAVTSLSPSRSLVQIARAGARPAGAVGNWFGHVAGTLSSHVPVHPFTTGLVLGLLPCGLLYSAVIAAAARGRVAGGVTSLVAFGLGTAPALLGVSVSTSSCCATARWMNRLSHVFVLAMGGWLVWRGLFELWGRLSRGAGEGSANLATP